MVTYSNWLFGAWETLALCLGDFAKLTIQNPNEPNQLSGNIALELERTASYLRGKPFVIRKDLQHANWAKRASELEGKSGKELEAQLKKSMIEELEGNG